MTTMHLRRPRIKGALDWTKASLATVPHMLLSLALLVMTLIACDLTSEVYITGEVREIDGTTAAKLETAPAAREAADTAAATEEPVPAVLQTYICPTSQGDLGACALYEESFLFASTIPAIHLPEINETQWVYLSSQMTLADGRVYRTRDLLEVPANGGTVPYDPSAVRPAVYLVVGEQGPVVDLIYYRQIDLEGTTTTITDIEVNIVLDAQVEEIINDMNAPVHGMLLGGCLSYGDELALATTHVEREDLLKGVEPDDYAKIWLVPGALCKLDVDIADPGGEWLYTDPPYTFVAPPGDQTLHWQTEELVFKRAQSNLTVHFIEGETLTNMELTLDEVAVAYLASFSALTYRADFVRYDASGAAEVHEVPLTRFDDSLTGSIEGLDEVVWEVYVYAFDGGSPVLKGFGIVDLANTDPDLAITFHYQAIIGIPSTWAANIFPQAALLDDFTVMGGITVKATGTLANCVPTAQLPDGCEVKTSSITGSYSYEAGGDVDYAPYTSLLQLPAGTYALQYSFPGYAPRTIQGFVVNDFDDNAQPIWIYLKPAP